MIHSAFALLFVFALGQSIQASDLTYVPPSPLVGSEPFVPSGWFHRDGNRYVPTVKTASVSFASFGDCPGGACSAANKPVRTTLKLTVRVVERRQPVRNALRRIRGR